MSEQRNLDHLTAEWLARGLSRRDLLRLLAAGAGASGLAAILAACGAEPASTPAAPTGNAAATTVAGAAPGVTTAAGTAPTAAAAAGATGGQVSI